MCCQNVAIIKAIGVEKMLKQSWKCFTRASFHFRIHMETQTLSLCVSFCRNSEGSYRLILELSTNQLQLQLLPYYNNYLEKEILSAVFLLCCALYLSNFTVQYCYSYLNKIYGYFTHCE